MKIIIFSKDRACQCDLTLSSLFNNGIGLCESVSVLYTYSDTPYKLGYEKLIEKWKSQVSFVLQDNFRLDVINLSTTLHELTCYFTDDDIIYRKIENVDKIYSTLNNNEVCAFSLRLGKNIRIQDYHRNIPIITPELKEEDGVILWNWQNTTPNNNYGYPLSVDGHIFRTNDIVRLIDRFDYDNPNSFEGRIQQFNNELAPQMAAFSSSHVVNTPLNRVQETCTNLAGIYYGITPEYFNQCWLEGFTLNIKNMDFSKVIGCHQELPMSLIKKVV